MKFFNLKTKIFKIFKNNKYTDKNYYNDFTEKDEKNIFEKQIFDFKVKNSNFVNFFLKNGLKQKYRFFLSYLVLNFNYFIKNNLDFIKINYPDRLWIVEKMVFKKSYYHFILEQLLLLIEPPFIIKTIPISKKQKKKLKKKYRILITYVKSDKRKNNSFKQLYFYSNSFNDNKLKIRLYKSFLYTFLTYENSFLCKLKYTLFKKFLKKT